MGIDSLSLSHSVSPPGEKKNTSCRAPQILCAAQEQRERRKRRTLPRLRSATQAERGRRADRPKGVQSWVSRFRLAFSFGRSHRSQLTAHRSPPVGAGLNGSGDSRFWSLRLEGTRPVNVHVGTDVRVSVPPSTENTEPKLESASDVDGGPIQADADEVSERQPKPATAQEGSVEAASLHQGRNTRLQIGEVGRPWN